MSYIFEQQVKNEFLKLKKNRIDSIENDRRIIGDRTFSIEPFPAGAFETLRRNSLWDNVFNYLDPSSIASAYRCCRTFRQISEKSVFVEVLKLLKKTRTLSRYWGKSPKNHDIWNLRLVSKTWKQAVEEFYFHNDFILMKYINHPHMHPNLTDLTLPKLFRGVEVLSESESPSIILQFLHLTINYSRYDFIMDFLRGYGMHISGMKFKSHGLSSVEHYKLLRDVVMRLPNIICLIVEMSTKPIREELDCDLESLRDFLRDHPFPSVPSMKFIRFECEEENELIVQEVLRANRETLSSVTLPSHLSIMYNSFGVENLVNVKYYHVRQVGAEMSQVMCLSSVQWPLKRLILDARHDARVTLPSLIPIINKINGTLECLELRLLSNSIPAGMENLNLPKLTKFSVFFFTEYEWESDLDFLLQCRLLKELCFSRVSSRARARNSLVQFVGYADKLEESNIWRWFPRLEFVLIGKHGALNLTTQFLRKGLTTVVRRTRVSNDEREE